MYAHRILLLSALVTLAPAALAQAPIEATSADATAPRYEGAELIVDAALGLPTPEEPLPSLEPAPSSVTAEPVGAGALGLPDSQALPEAPDPAALLAVDTLRSPVDTLRMSAWERVWWGSGGLMRKTGLFPIHPGDPAADFRQIATTRRRMLSLHQLLGFATVASLTATVVGGQIALDGGSSGLHKASLPVTVGLYATTATLALTSPPKLVPGRGGFDSITLHRYLAVAHLAGMAITPLLAPELEHGDSEGNAQTHQVMGYATLGTLTAAMLLATFLR